MKIPSTFRLCCILTGFVIGGTYVLQSAVNVGIGKVLGHPVRGAVTNFVVATLLLVLPVFVGEFEFRTWLTKGFEGFVWSRVGSFSG